MAKLLENGSKSHRITIPKHIVDELGWTKKTKLSLKRKGKSIVIKED